MCLSTTIAFLQYKNSCTTSTCQACNLNKILYNVLYTTCVAPTTLPSNCTNGDVRLSGGSLSSEGYVQVCINNAWGSVCGSNWDSQDGNVVCKQLGLLPRGNAN